MRVQDQRSRATLWLLIPMIVFSITGCVKIPQHNFLAPPPTIAPTPPVPSSATVRFGGIPSAPIGAALIDAVPRKVAAQHFPGGCANPCYDFELQTFDAVLNNGRLVMSPTYRGPVQAKTNFAECDLNPVIVDVAITARPVVKRSGTQWVLSLAEPKVQPSIGAGSDTHCVIGGLIDVSGTLQSNLNNISGSMQSKIEALTFPVPVDDLSSKLLGPIKIPGSGGRTFCLYPNVSDLQIGTIEAFQPAFVGEPEFVPLPNPIKTSLPKLLSVPLAFLGAPSVVATTASCPPAQPLTGDLRLADGATQLPFQLFATVAADYPALSDAVTGTLKPTQGRWGPFKLTVKPTRVQLGNANGQVFAALSLTGSLSGTVFFWGTPLASEDGRSVSIPNLNLAAESRTALASKNVRLPDFVASVFRKPLQDAFLLNLDKVLPQTGGTQPISVPLANNGVLELGSLKVTIDSVKSVEGQLQANIVVKGDASAQNH